MDCTIRVQFVSEHDCQKCKPRVSNARSQGQKSLVCIEPKSELDAIRAQDPTRFVTHNQREKVERIGVHFGCVSAQSTENAFVLSLR